MSLFKSLRDLAISNMAVFSIVSNMNSLSVLIIIIIYNERRKNGVEN